MKNIGDVIYAKLPKYPKSIIRQIFCDSIGEGNIIVELRYGWCFPSDNHFEVFSSVKEIVWRAVDCRPCTCEECLVVGGFSNEAKAQENFNITLALIKQWVEELLKYNKIIWVNYECFRVIGAIEDLQGDPNCLPFIKQFLDNVTVPTFSHVAYPRHIINRVAGYYQLCVYLANILCPYIQSFK